jgi:transposase-like protein
MEKQKREESIPEGLLTKDFLKTLHGQEDVDRFLNDLHARLYEQLLQAEMDEHLGYEKHSIEGNNSGNSRNGISII